ncbi:hypothetical protein BJX70DRAFT_258303 [Aspergillus crustosus]
MSGFSSSSRHRLTEAVFENPSIKLRAISYSRWDRAVSVLSHHPPRSSGEYPKKKCSVVRTSIQVWSRVNEPPITFQTGPKHLISIMRRSGIKDGFGRAGGHVMLDVAFKYRTGSHTWEVLMLDFTFTYPDFTERSCTNVLCRLGILMYRGE